MDKKFRLLVKPSDLPEEVEEAEKFLKKFGFKVEKVETDGDAKPKEVEDGKSEGTV